MLFKTCPAILALVASLAVATPVPSTTNEVQGVATIYEQQGAAGSCGQVHPESDLIVALSNSWMQGQPNSPYCGRRIRVRNLGGNGIGGDGKFVEVTVADTCPGCESGHLDLSTGAWNQLTDNSAWGVVQIAWEFV